MSNLALIVSDMYCIINNKIIINSTFQVYGIEIIDISVLQNNDLDFNYKKPKLKFSEINVGKFCLKLNKKFNICFKKQNDQKNIVLNLIFCDDKYFLIKDSYLLTKINSIKFINISNSLLK